MGSKEKRRVKWNLMALKNVAQGLCKSITGQKIWLEV